MNFKQICTELSKQIDPQKAEEMARIVGSEFVFKGLDVAARAEVIKPQLDAAMEEDTELDWEFIDTCWEQNIREFQYFALSYLTAMRHLLQKDDLPKLKTLIVEKASWDTNNILHKLINLHTALYPEMTEIVVKWSGEKNPWLQRTALLFQLGRAQYVDLKALETILDNTIKTRDEYVEKAVVGALKDVHPHFPDFVDNYIQENSTSFNSAMLEELNNGGVLN